MKRLRNLVALAVAAGVCAVAVLAGAQDLPENLDSFDLKSVAVGGAARIDASTGRLNYVVPLYTVRDLDIELPIRLVYDGSGVKVDEPSGVVGLKWSLQAGGAIHRTVNQIPDEWATLQYLTPYNDWIQTFADKFSAQTLSYLKIPESHAGGWIVNTVPPCHYAEKYCNMTLDGYPITNWCNPNAGGCHDLFGTLMHHKNAAVYQLVDVAPDDFTFVVGDQSGEFILEKDGVVRHLEEKDVQLAQRLREPSPPHVWEMTDNRGVRYYFDRGGIQYAPHGGPRPDPKESLFTYDSEFPLAAVESPAGRRIEIDYELLFGFIGEREELEGCKIADCPEGVLKPNGFEGDITWRMYQVPVVREIRSSREIVRFTYENLWHDPQEQHPNDATNTVLAHIEVINRADGSLIKRYDFGYEDEGRRKQLKRILDVALHFDEINVFREFLYDDTPRPGPASFEKDVFGYQNANAAGNLIPVASCRPGQSPADRGYHPARIQAGVLKEVRLPTGGRTRFEYAPKTAAPDGGGLYAGGLVIRRVTDIDADGSVAGSKFYRYEELTGFALDPADPGLFTRYFEYLRRGFGVTAADVCKPIAGTNRYAFMDRVTASYPLHDFFDPDSLYRHPQSGEFANTRKSGGSFYRRVSIDFGDQGREVLHYDVRETAHSVKGLLTRAELFNAAGAKLKQLDYGFRLERRSGVAYGHIQHRKAGGWPEGVEFFFDPANKITGWLLLESLSTTLYGDGGVGAFTTTKSYVYSPERHHNPVSELTATSEGGVQVTTFRYAHDLFDQAMIERNMVGIALESLVEGGAGGGAKVAYRKWPDGAILPWKHYRFGSHPGGCTEGAIGGWSLKTTVESYADGQPTTVRAACDPHAVELEWRNDLPVQRRYADRTWRYRYYAGDHRSGLLRESIDFDGTTLFYDYDGFRRLNGLLEKDDLVGHTIQTQLAPGESFQRTTTSLQGSGIPVPPVHVVLDGFGRERRTLYEGYTPSGQDFVASLTYDTQGRITRLCDPSTGGCLQLEFEPAPLERLKRGRIMGWPQAQEIRYGVNGAGEVAGYAAGTLWKVVTIDENGNPLTEFSDRLDRRVLVRRHDGGLDIDTLYRYNHRGDPVEIILPGGGGVVLTYHADGLPAGLTSPHEGTVSFVYNTLDRLSATVDAAGNVTTFAYNAHGQPLRTYVNGLLTTTVAYGAAPGPAKGKVTSVVSETQGELQGSIATSYAYDGFGRLQRETVVNHLGGQDDTLFRYDLRDLLVRSERQHTGPYGDLTIIKEYDYDHAGRLTDIYMTVGGGPREHISALAYDERDWVARKRLGVRPGGALQSIDYGYNLRGWLTHINDLRECADQFPDPRDPGAKKAGGSGPTPTPCLNPENDLFAEEIVYTAGVGPLGAEPQYNGNVAGLRWRVMDRPAIPAYGFRYDGLDRLTDAVYGEKTVGGTAPGLWTHFSRYDVQIGPYDEQGNILNLARRGLTGGSGAGAAFGLIDDLAFSYQNGRLSSVSEAASTARGFTGAGGGYLYDARGNMVRDIGRDLTVAYTALGLPAQIASGGHSLRFTYDSFGTKLRMKQTTNGKVSTVDYLGGIEVRGGALVVYHEEGRYRAAAGRHEYVLRDHRGNTRIVFSDTNGDGAIAADPAAGEVLQEHHYYPHGMAMEGDFIAAPANGDAYRYNGLEQLPRLDVYGSHFRSYEPAIARWWQADPVWYPAESAYAANRNNPLRFVDPSGAQPEDLQAMQKELGIDYCILLPTIWVVDHPRGGGGDDWADYGADAYYYGWAFDTWGYGFPGYDEEPTPERFDWKSIIPVYGSGRDAYRAFKEGRWLAGLGNSALAISDVALVKSLFFAGGKLALKGGLKVGGSHSWNATKAYWAKKGITQLASGSKHHWLISQKMMERYPQLKPLGNQFWNIKTFSSHAEHMRLAHGQSYGGLRGAGPLGQVWYGTPTWPKAIVGSYGGRAVGYNLPDWEQP